ncbi:hypothetical protein N7537_007489 [Penicillium hordei]|uniref:Uncharacterized protein n=1 Tax=Penicillium hordei TaxID=40994 RepID=A0AAD6DYJ4_9EURO|nr:uncharacterized protein N7537_007489 [Penicillium hordei]KAJ5597405.1 hypothetical protein N7537_007489 [Penicillium hordei]
MKQHFPLAAKAFTYSRLVESVEKDFSPEKYIRLDYVENSHGATKKLDGENKDNRESARAKGQHDSVWT